MGKRRNQRVDQRVREAVAEALEGDIADPRVAFVSITDARVSEDHRHATVYYTTLDPSLIARDPARSGGDRVPDQDDVADGLVSAAARIQGLLARRVRLKHTPTLTFAADEVAERGRRIDELLAAVHPPDETEPPTR